MIIVVFFVLLFAVAGMRGKVRWIRYTNPATMGFDLGEDPFEKYLSTLFGAILGLFFGLGTWWMANVLSTSHTPQIECAIVGIWLSWLYPWFRTYNEYTGRSSPRPGEKIYRSKLHRLLSAICGGIVAFWIGQVLINFKILR
jgi:hypothetical protein